ncbi:MAG: TIGR03790 family protein [Candidatus Paceibacterota bacterium]
MKYKILKRNFISKVCITIIIFLIFLGVNFSAFAATPTNQSIPTASEVLVVYNSSYVTDSDSDGVQDSLEIANYYKNKRSIPNANILGIEAPTTEEITRTQYNTNIKSGIESYLTSSGLKNSIKYIVLVKGIPLKILVSNGTQFDYGTTDNSSVDAAVCLLYETYSTAWHPLNPYYNVDPSYTKQYRFDTEHFSTNGVYLRYLVTRLDGYTMSDIKGMIDRAFISDTSGSGYWVIDDHQKGYDYMQTVWTSLNNLGQNLNPSSWSDSTNYITTNPLGSVIGYISHGIHADMGDGYVSNSPVNANHLDFTLLPGAVFSSYESFNAFGFVNKTQSTHGQVAEWIEIGGSGGIGNVYEPWASGIAHEEIFMPAYAIGYSWADAAYQSLVYMDFVSVILGDPLMTIRDSTPPSEVTNLQAVASDTEVILSWINPVDADFVGVKILRKTGSYPVNSADGTVIFTGVGTSYTNTGLTNDTTYYYTIFAYDEVPNYSPGSSSGAKAIAIPSALVDVTSPSEITNLRAVALDARVILSWTNPVNADFVGVKILRKTGSYPTNSADGTLIYNNTGTSFIDTNGGLVNDTTYYYTIFAYDEVPNYSPDSSSGARATATPLLIGPSADDIISPNKPTSFSAVPGNHQISLSWVNPSNSDFSGVKILRRTNYYPISPTNGTLVYKGTNTTYINTGLTNGTTYFYTIFAFDAANNFSVVDHTVKSKATPYLGSLIADSSDADSESTVFTEPNMTTQGNVADMTAIISSGRVILTWTNPFNDVNWKGTKIVRKIGSYSTSPTDGKMVYSGDASSYIDVTVSSGVTYYYTAFAYNDWRNYSDGTVSGAKITALAQ